MTDGQVILWDFEIDPQRIKAYYLENGQLRTVPISQLMGRRWPVQVGAKPQVVLIEGHKKQAAWTTSSNVWYALGYLSADYHWQVHFYGSSGIHLKDRFGFETKIGESSGMIEATLKVIQEYTSVADLLYTQISEQCVPLLQETKGSLGKSPVLEIIREVLERGPSLIQLNYTLDIPAMVTKRQELYKSVGVA